MPEKLLKRAVYMRVFWEIEDNEVVKRGGKGGGGTKACGKNKRTPEYKRKQATTKIVLPVPMRVERPWRMACS